MREMTNWDDYTDLVKGDGSKPAIVKVWAPT